jgi:lysine 2,3-aminomutase
MPTYVLDIPGGFGKVPLTNSPVRQTAGNTFEVRDRKGGSHAYPPAGDVKLG